MTRVQPPEGDNNLPAGPLQTVSRSLDVLLSYSETRTDWGVYELAENFGWTKSSAQRVLAALAAKGFLWADPYSRRYSLGPAVWRMASLWERTGGLARLAQDPLKRLASDTELTALLSIPDGSYMRCVASVNGVDGPIRTQSLVGELYPGHASATSRAYFSFIDPMERRALLYGKPMGRYSEETTTDETQLEKLFSETQQTGYVITRGEWDPSTYGAAAPVMMGRRVAASVTLIAAKDQVDLADFVANVPRLLDAAGELSELLSNRVSAPQRNWRRGITAAGRPG